MSRGGWLFTKRGKLVGYVVDCPPSNENAVRERDERLERMRLRHPDAKEQYLKDGK